MASRDRDKVGSSVSMLGSFQAGGDAIPREYHRKVLKKIAQLTKVCLCSVHQYNNLMSELCA